MAFFAADRFAKRDPRIVERVFAGEAEFMADRTLEELYGRLLFTDEKTH